MLPIPDLSQLKHLRVALHLSQQDLAKRAGVSQSLIAKIEAGRMDPSLSNAQKIAKALAEESPKETRVKQVMSKSVVSFPPETVVVEAVKEMKKKGISQFPVLKDGLVLGRITESLILDHVDELATATLKDIMLSPPPMVDKETAIPAILPLLQAYNMILVVDKGCVSGIITKADVMNAALQKKI